MIKNQLFIAAALFVGVAIGYFVQDSRAKPEPLADDAGYVAASQIGDEGEAASVKALRARIAELEKLLAAKDAEKVAARVAEAKPVAEEQGARRGPPSMKEMRERMEQMAKENPEQFAQITNAMARWRQRRLERANAKLDFLESVDTSAMSAEQKKSHEEYQRLIARREQLEEKMHNPDMTDEDRDDIFRDMRETDHALRQVARAERATLIDQTTKALGFTGDEATAVSETISDIISSTEQGHGFGPPPGGGPGGGSGGPGGRQK